MPVVTKIKPQKNKTRVNIYLDGNFGFGLDRECLFEFDIKTGDEFTKRDINKIIEKSKLNKTYENILKFASLRPRSKMEFSVWFKKHKIDEVLHNKLLKKLKRLDLVGDKKFAVWWIDQRLQFKCKSEKELILELKAKGIEKNIIDDVISDANINEIQTAKKLIQKKKYLWEKYDDFEARKKASNYLMRKGFGWDVIREVVNKLYI